MGPEEGSESDFFSIEFELGNTSTPPTKIDVMYDGVLHEHDDHVGVLILEHHWGSGTFNNEAGGALVFLPDEPTRQLDLSWTATRRRSR